MSEVINKVHPVDLVERNGEVEPLTVEYIMTKYLKPVHKIDSAILTFISAYVSCRHVAQAAKAANISTASGNNLLNKPDIYETIKQLGLASARKYGFDASEVLARVNEIAQVDPIGVLNEDGTVKDPKLMDPSVRRAIKKMTVKEHWDVDPNGFKQNVIGRTVNIEFWDKMKGLELLGKQENLFKDTVVHEHDIGKNAAAILLKTAEKRALMAAREVRQISSLPEIESDDE